MLKGIALIPPELMNSVPEAWAVGPPRWSLLSQWNAVVAGCCPPAQTFQNTPLLGWQHCEPCQKWLQSAKAQAGYPWRLISEHRNTNLNPGSKPKEEFWTYAINLECPKGAARNYLQHPRMAWVGRDLTNHPVLTPSSDMGTGWRWLSLHSFLLTAGLQWVAKTLPQAGTSCDAP